MIAMSLALLGGCTFSSMQADMAQRAARLTRGLLPSAAQGKPDDRYAWLLRFNQLETIVYAIDKRKGLVFANRAGTVVRFDGHDIVGADNLPQAVDRFRVAKLKGGRRIYQIAGIGKFEVTCSGAVAVANDQRTDCIWEEGPASSDVLIKMTHWVRRDDQGRLRRLEAQIVPGAPPLILQRRSKQ